MRNRIIRFFTEDRVVFTVISLNAFILFLLSFPLLDPYQFWFELIDSMFLAYFILEAIFKIRRYGWRRYISSGWNRFDLALVILSAPSVLVLLHGAWADLSWIFLLRTIRVARFFKFLRFVPNMAELLAGIKRAFRASVFVLLAFFVYGFVMSLISCRLFHRMSPEMFGDPLRSFYHIFQVFTIEGWNEIPKTLLSQANVPPGRAFAIQLYFIFIVITGGLFGLSLVNAIFVEEMVRDNEDDLRASLQLLHEKVDSLQKERDGTA